MAKILKPGLVAPSRRGFITGAAAAAAMAALPADAAGPAVRAALLGSIYCQEARTAFAAMSAMPSAPMRRLYDICIRSLIAAGIWTKLDALYLMNAEAAQAARVNIKSPGTYDLTAVSSPTFTAKSGYAGDGASAYLSTNFNPSTASSPNYVQNSAGLFLWGLKAAADASGAMGYITGGNAYLFPRWTDNNIYTRLNDADTAVATATGLGLTHGNRSASSAVQIYRDGVSVKTAATVSTAIANATLALLRSSASAFYSGGLAMAGVCGSLNSTEAAALYSALNTFKTGVDALP